MFSTRVFIFLMSIFFASPSHGRVLFAFLVIYEGIVLSSFLSVLFIISFLFFFFIHIKHD